MASAALRARWKSVWSLPQPSSDAVRTALDRCPRLFCVVGGRSESQEDCFVAIAADLVGYSGTTGGLGGRSRPLGGRLRSVRRSRSRVRRSVPPTAGPASTIGGYDEGVSRSGQ